MTGFAENYNLGDSERKGGKGYYVAAILCVVMLIVLGATSLFIGKMSSYESDTVPGICGYIPRIECAFNVYHSD